MYHNEFVDDDEGVDVRRVLAEDYRYATDEELEDELGLGFVDAVEQLQEVSFDLGRIGRAIGKALPGAIRGAVSGAAVGGLPGAIAGGIAGGAGSFVGGSTPPSPTNKPAQAVANVPAAQLLQMLLRPEVLQAIAAMALGKRGASTVDTGGAAVPVQAIATMLQQLASRAATEHETKSKVKEELALDEESSMAHAQLIFDRLSDQAEEESILEDDEYDTPWLDESYEIDDVSVGDYEEFLR